MNHRYHDRKALGESKSEPDSARGSGSARSPRDVAEATLRHDLANWFAVLRGHLDLLREGVATDHSLARMASALDVCEALIAGERIDSGSTELPIALADCAAHVSARATGIRVEIDCPQGLRVAVPAAELGNLLWNLANNAIRATGERGLLRFVVREEGDRIALTLVDQGQGMSEEVLARCLDPGFSTQEGEGHGLGLASVHATLEAFGGGIRIDSRPAEGTTVHLLLPRAQPSTASRSSSGTTGARVLVVEDETAVAEVLFEMIGALGHRAEVYGRGLDVAEEAWSSADLVLLDQGLPDASGSDLALRVRQEHPDLAIVLLTGDPASARGIAPKAIDLVVGKPVGMEVLRELIDASQRSGRDGIRLRGQSAEA